MQRDVFAIVFGVLVTAVISGTLVIAGLKAGITPGVSPLVILVAWGAFAARTAGQGGTRFLNLAQVAGSAGMAVCAGVIFTAPVVQILYADLGREVPAVDIPTLILLSLAGSLIGFGFVGIATKKFLSDPTLPAPEARACETMIETAVAEKAARPRLGRSLFAGVFLGFLAPLVWRLGLALEELKLFSTSNQDDSRSADIALPLSPIYIGIGGLLTLATALLVFGGSSCRLLGDWLLAGIDSGTDAAALFPANSMRWVGGGAMTVAVVYSLYRFLGNDDGAGAAQQAGDGAVLEVDQGHRRRLIASIAAGVLLIVGWLVFKDGLGVFSLGMSLALLVMAGLMVTLGAILSLQIGSSASPVSGTIFVTTLVLCLVALAMGRHAVEDVLILTPLIVAACVAVCAANDSSQDYKTLQLCGVRVQDGFLAQILGLLAGCIVVPIVLYVAHEAYTLGSDDLVAPQGKMFATLIQALLLSADEPLPWYPIGIGLAVGVFAVAMDIAGQRKGIQLPSMALAVGIYLPAAIGIGILIGATCRWIAGRGTKQRNESILAAAGLITGAALIELLLGIAILFGLRLESFRQFVTPAELAELAEMTKAAPEHWRQVGAWLPNVLTGAAIVAAASLLFVNSKRKA